MTADVIHDLDSHLDSGHVWRLELEQEWQDDQAEPPNGVYTVCNSRHRTKSESLAMYIAHTLYPDISFITMTDQPCTRDNYVSSRDRSRV
jgi:hypothetical protein